MRRRVQVRSDHLDDLEYEDIDWILGINLNGVLHGTKEFCPT